MFKSVICIIQHKLLASQIHQFLYSIEFGTVTDIKLVSVHLVLVLLQCATVRYVIVSEEHGASFIVTIRDKVYSLHRLHKYADCNAAYIQKYFTTQSHIA
jgi:hypothetical protein